MVLLHCYPEFLIKQEGDRAGSEPFDSNWWHLRGGFLFRFTKYLSLSLRIVNQLFQIQIFLGNSRFRSLGRMRETHALVCDSVRGTCLHFVAHG